MGRKAKAESSGLADSAIEAPLFGQVVGQKAACNRLRRAIENHRVAHAYLFTGPAGVGKSAMAMDFAAALLCEKFDSAPEQAPCRTCAQCRLTARLQHPDLHILVPIPGKTAIRRMEEGRKRALDSEDGERESAPEATRQDRFGEVPIIEIIDQRLLDTLAEKSQNPYVPVLLNFPELLLRTLSILIEQITILIKQAYRSPYQARRKVFLFFHADRMNISAQNAFLKVLEEPPANTYFLLACEGEGTLAATIRSRCQHIPLPPLLEADIEEALRKQNPDLGENIPLIARLAGGNFWQATELARMDWKALQETAIGYFAACVRLDPFELEDHYEKIFSEDFGGYRIALGALQLFIDDVAILKAERLIGKDMHLSLSHPAYRKRAEVLLDKFPEVNPEQAVQAIQFACDYLERGYTPGRILTALSFRLHHALGPSRGGAKTRKAQPASEKETTK
jgi:DNA polymerase-3 subunit delta'